MTQKQAKPPQKPKSTKRTRKIFTHFRVLSALSILLLSFIIDIDPQSLPIIRTLIPQQTNQLKYWGICLDKWNRNDNLRTMKRVFDKLNIKPAEHSQRHTSDIVWSIEGPGVAPYEKIKRLRQHQKVNHFPGNAVLVTKSYMNLYNSHLPYILPSFRMPFDRTALDEFIKSHPDAKFVRKNQHNRGVRIISTKDINDQDPDEFFQVFLDKPLLVDGHAFDLGVFVLITSLDPLRIYRFNHEILLRFCPKKYHPFDAEDVDRYVVQDGHKSMYEMKNGFGEEYEKYSVTFKELFERHLRAYGGHDVRKMWERVDDAIVSVIQNSATMMLDTIKFQERNVNNYFELVRFDFMIDKNLDVFIMEVNMSPNMTPAEARFEENTKIYEPMIYTTVQMIGGGSHHEFFSRFTNDTTIITNKNLAASGENCINHNCISNCHKDECQLCLPCLSTEMVFNIREAYREWRYQGEFKRIFPSRRQLSSENVMSEMSDKNRVLVKWYRDMCMRDSRFC